MIGCFSEHAVGLKYPLLDAPYALIRQSREDRAGKSHRDGWGVACLNDHSLPQVEKNIKPAFEDGQFDETASRLQAPVWLAHVRAASSGGVRLENTHPFYCGNWAWMHNGTIIRPLELLGDMMLANADPRFRSLRRGATDSELCFLLFLSELARRAGTEIDNPPVETAAAAMSAAIHFLHTIAAPFKQKDPTMNFMASNGMMLIASRWGKTLWTLERPPRGLDPPAVFVASEPFDDEAWQEAPDQSCLVVDAVGRLNFKALNFDKQITTSNLNNS
jgi:glutamine amidotransferase